MAYVPMAWELAPDQTKWSVNINPPGAAPYYIATSQQQELQEAQIRAWADELNKGPTSPTLTPRGSLPAGKQPIPLPTTTAQSTRDTGVTVATQLFGTYQPRTITPRPVSPGTRISIVPTVPVSTAVTGSKTGDVLETLGGACDGIQDAYLRGICKAGVGVATRRTGTTGGTGTATTGADPRAETLAQPAGCSPGYVSDGKGGCKKAGVVGAIERYLPGGDSGTMADVYGEAVMGAMGIPALYPAVVGSISRNDGSTGPVLRCPAGAVLGRDDLCYMKGSIPRNWRKHPPGTKPFLTGGQVRILRKAKGLESRFKRLTSGKGALFKKAPKCGSCSRGKKK